MIVWSKDPSEKSSVEGEVTSKDDTCCGSDEKFTVGCCCRVKGCSLKAERSEEEVKCTTPDEKVVIAEGCSKGANHKTNVAPNNRCNVCQESV